MNMCPLIRICNPNLLSIRICNPLSWLHLAQVGRLAPREQGCNGITNADTHTIGITNADERTLP